LGKFIIKGLSENKFNFMNISDIEVNQNANWGNKYAALKGYLEGYLDQLAVSKEAQEELVSKMISELANSFPEKSNSSEYARLQGYLQGYLEQMSSSKDIQEELISKFLAKSGDLFKPVVKKPNVNLPKEPDKERMPA
jgi:hypothetical protein